MDGTTSKLEILCLKGINESPKLIPLFQLDIVGEKLCSDSHQRVPGERGKERPDCDHCSTQLVYVEKSDVLDGWYRRCKYPIKEVDEV